MAKNTFNTASLLDCQSNICNAIAAIKSAAIERSSDTISALQHAAEGVLTHALAAQEEGTETALSDAFVRIACLADLIDDINLSIDDQLLHAASVLLHLANEQLVEPTTA